MKNPSPTLRILGSILFFAGILLGMLLFGGLTWANLEADFYFGFGAQAKTSIKMSCPLIMNPAESGRVSVSITNPSERVVEPLIQVDFSGGLLRSLRQRVTIQPGETRTVDWEIGRGDIEFGHLILAKVYQFQALSLDSADGTCGILMIDLPGLSGEQVYFIILGASLLLGLIGFLAWALAGRRPADRSNDALGMLLLAAIVLTGILVASAGWWVPGLLALTAALLLAAILISRLVSAQR